MADTPYLALFFRGGCPDCGVREARLPPPLPDPGDDFDWTIRDYDDFRLFMLEELAARFPERRRWTPADLEVVLVEALATILDQLSDMADRVANEAYLDTARKPETVRRLLAMIGYDALDEALATGQVDSANPSTEALERYWRANPTAMEVARRRGPWEIHRQKRMVTVADYALRLREHPLVIDAQARSAWSGSWYRVQVTVIGHNLVELDTPMRNISPALWQKIQAFHRRAGVSGPAMNTAQSPSIRSILHPYLEAYRMVGQEVLLLDPVPIGIYIAFSIRIAAAYFRSEIRNEISRVLGRGAGGFFEPGKRGFGEDIHTSDLIEALMTIDGIEQVCINRFKRVGRQFADRAERGFIELRGVELAVCDNGADPARGYFRIDFHGGRKG